MLTRALKLLSPKPSKKKNRAPCLRQGLRIYAIGDLHGRLDLLTDITASISVDLLNNPIYESIFVFLGDYVDRGPDSAGVVEFLSELSHDPSVVCLRGNHEQILLNFLNDASVMEQWRHHGGLETLSSYGVPTEAIERGSGYEEAQYRLLQRMPQSHLNFLEKTKFQFVRGDYFFCHAGVNPKAPLGQQKPADLLWIRDDFIKSERMLGKVIVHGHTPVPEPEVLPHRINMDTGAYSSDILSCLVLEGRRQRILKTAGLSDMDTLPIKRRA